MNLVKSKVRTYGGGLFEQVFLATDREVEQYKQLEGYELIFADSNIYDDFFLGKFQVSDLEVSELSDSEYEVFKKQFGNLSKQRTLFDCLDYSRYFFEIIYVIDRRLSGMIVHTLEDIVEENDNLLNEESDYAYRELLQKALFLDDFKYLNVLAEERGMGSLSEPDKHVFFKLIKKRVEEYANDLKNK